MSWKRRAERAYHHGNLREALIQAARELIKEKGPAGFTFADAARSAGVSAAAPRAPPPPPPPTWPPRPPPLPRPPPPPPGRCFRSGPPPLTQPRAGGGR